MILSEIRQRVQDRISDSTASTQSIVDEKINETLEEIYNRTAKARWYYRQASFNTLAQRTGSSTLGSTVSVKKGERLAEFSATAGALPKRYIGADILITGDSESYRIVDIGLPGVDPEYTLAGGAASDAKIWERYIYLDRPYQGTTDTAAVYTITQDVYFLRSDVNEYEWICQQNYPQRSTPIPVATFRTWVPEPISNGATGDPTVHHNLGRVSIEWVNNLCNEVESGPPSATTATITATQNSFAVQLEDVESGMVTASPLWSASAQNRGEDLQGIGLRVGATERVYIVRKSETRSSPAAYTIDLLLEERYKGSTVTDGTSFVVGHIDAPVIQFYPVPTSSVRIEYGYFTKEYLLEAGEDSPILPREFHTVIVDGATWRMLDFLESDKERGAFVRYEKGLMRIERSAQLNRDRIWKLKAGELAVQNRALNLGPHYPPLIVKR